MSASLRWESMPSGVLSCVGTVVWNENTGSAVLIDPTDDASTFLDFVRENALKPKLLLLTHAHFDHAAGACDAGRSTGLVPHLHRDDWPLFNELPAWGAKFGLEAKAPDIAPVHVEHGETLEIEDGFRLQVLHTPGHTQGQVAYHFSSMGLVVVGDTLFHGSVGRTDLPGGDADQLVRSIQRHLYTLPDATVVVPGHGPHTSIGREKKSNPFVRAQ